MIEVMVEDVGHWVDQKAAEIADNYEVMNERPGDLNELFRMVERECDEFARGWIGRALAIIAEYNWSAALSGTFDEEGPLVLFTNDVYQTAKDELKRRGFDFNESD